MATGSVPLLLAADYDKRSPLARGVVDYLVRESPIIESIPWISFDGEAFASREQDQRPTVGFRNVNATYSRTYGTERRHFWGVAIAGGEVFVDNFIVRTRGNSAATKANQFAMVARHAAAFMDHQVIDGTGTAGAFKGFNTLIGEGFGQTALTTTNGSNLATAGLAYIDKAIDLVRTPGLPDAFWCNRSFRRQITTLGRNLTGYSLIDVGNDAFGRLTQMYSGIPMRIIGDDEAGTQILGFDETAGSSSICSSAYLIKFDTGDEQSGLTGLLGAGGSMEVVDFGETQAAPGHLGRIEFYPGIAVLNKFSLVRLSGILTD